MHKVLIQYKANKNAYRVLAIDDHLSFLRENKLQYVHDLCDHARCCVESMIKRRALKWHLEFFSTLEIVTVDELSALSEVYQIEYGVRVQKLEDLGFKDKGFENFEEEERLANLSSVDFCHEMNENSHYFDA